MSGAPGPAMPQVHQATAVAIGERALLIEGRPAAASPAWRSP
jgi:hypothetical protein